MTDFRKTLLPLGFEDLVGARALRAHRILTRTIDHFLRADYQLVEPALMEYEESLVAAPDAPQSQDIFRLIDPLSHRTIAFRGDITLQVIRLARDHLQQQPRPLRLCYHGPVLRIANTPLRPQRQFIQLGLEQIGGDDSAETEILQIALDALLQMGIEGLCLDFALPTLIRRLLSSLDPAAQKLVAARDIGSFERLIAQGKVAAETGANVCFLLKLAPEPHVAVPQLLEYPAFSEERRLLLQLQQIVETLRQSHSSVQISLDLVEQASFAYKTGVAYSFLARGQNALLGRGGRYNAGDEPACGASFNLNNLLAHDQNKDTQPDNR